MQIERSETTVPSAPSSPRHVDAAGALRYGNDAMLRRYVSEHGVDAEYAERLFLETKKFLILCALRSGMLTPSAEQDKMWHHFIVHTQDYAAFCDAFFGRFIHHVPCEGIRPDQACRTKLLAHEAFQWIDETLWARPTDALRCCDYC